MRGPTGIPPRHTSKVFIEITDDGPGIPNDIMERVFEPFFTTKEVGQGLALAHKIVVDQHQGCIKLDSEVGVGTTFTIEIPLTPQATAT